MTTSQLAQVSINTYNGKSYNNNIRPISDDKWMSCKSKKCIMTFAICNVIWVAENVFEYKINQS